MTADKLNSMSNKNKRFLGVPANIGLFQRLAQKAQKTPKLIKNILKN